ncbi:MAG: NAD-dependent epimerase/dehydratase family protein [Candidatus Aenigmatarchaeota archaeon]
MKVLVTGVAGFIGSHIAEKLIEMGFKVYGIDNLNTGNLENIKDLDIIFIKGNSRKILELKEKIDVIFHNGIYSSSSMYKQNPFLVSEVIWDMLAILEYAKKNKCKIILASTSSLYNENPIPWREDMEIKVTDYYTEARYACERLCKLYGKLFKVKCISLRYFSVYGEREEYKGNYANVLTQMIWHALKQKEFEIFGDGNQSRDLIYVKDVVEANIKALEFEDFNEENFEIFNVGRGKLYSFNEIASLINKFIELKIKYVNNPISNYVYHTLADIKKAEKKLKFKAKYDVEEILPKLIKYYQNNIEKIKI